MKALVTGGGGFLGRRIVELLVERGDEVGFLARNRYPDVERLGARGFQVDLGDPQALRAAIAGSDTVFHVAAKSSPPWGVRKEFWAANVTGTRNVLEACRAAGVKRLVFTSTPSVTGRTSDVENGRADEPYPGRYPSPYAETKAEAERLVMSANGSDLATIALRPPLIFGPCDPHFVPRLIERGAAGRLRIIGSGKPKVDLTYVDNAALAHLKAADALVDSTAVCSGKAYFVSNGEPLLLWDFVNRLLQGVGLQPVTRHIPYALALQVSRLMDWAWRYLPLRGEALLTPIVVQGFAHSHWYDPEPARNDFGYVPKVPMDEAISRTIAWFKDGRPRSA
jgi:2-alkyl-3-oxoalkanoate reductase